MIEYPPVAKLDIAADSDSEGGGSNPSGRATTKILSIYVGGIFFLVH